MCGLQVDLAPGQPPAAGRPRFLAPGSLTWAMIARVAAVEHNEKKEKSKKRKRYIEERF